MANITSFTIDNKDLIAAASVRSFTITGDIGAEFTLQVFATPVDVNTAHKFYNFKTRVFGGCVSENKLTVKMKSNSFSGSIAFPANSNGDTYSFLLLPAVDKGTNINFGNGLQNQFESKITQIANSTMTFTPITTATSSYESMPTSVTSVASRSSTNTIEKEINWDVENKDNDANGFGLRLIRQPIDTDWYIEITDTVNNRLDNTIEKTFSTVNGAVDNAVGVTLNQDYREAGGGEILVDDYVFLTSDDGTVTLGTKVAALDVDGDAKDITLSAAATISNDDSLEFITASKEIIVDSLTDIVTGMVISAVSGTNSYLIGTPIITAINTETNTLTLSTTQAFVDNITLKFQARGSSTISKITGAVVDFSNWNANITSATTEQLTKTVRTTATGTTVQLNGTRGIAGGDVVTVRGLNIVNTSENKIQTNRTDGSTATASGTAGEIILEVTQVVKSGTKIYFDGCTLKITLKNTIKIAKHPSSDRTIYLNLDNFITPGAGT